MAIFDANKFHQNISSAENDSHQNDHIEFYKCYDYLQHQFDKATKKGQTSIIVDDTMSAKILKHINELTDKFESVGIILDYSDYPVIEIKVSPLFKPTRNVKRRSAISLKIMLVVGIVILSTVVSYFILDCIPLVNPLSHPIVLIILSLAIASFLGSLYNKFK